MNKLYFTFLVVLIIFSGLSQSPTNYWEGTVDTVWNNSANWSTGFVPNTNDSVIVNSTATNDLAVMSSASCKYLTIIGTGKVKTYVGANLNVDNDLTIGLGAGGSLRILSGSISIDRYLQTKRNSSFDIYDGSISFQEWVENFDDDLFYAKGNITLTGGSISGISIYFSNIDLVGVMNGPFVIELSGNLYTSENWNITGGHVLLTHTSWMGGIGFAVSPDGPNPIGKICDVTLDFPNTSDYHTSIPFEAEKMIINGNLNITRGTMKTHKNFWYNVILDTLEIQGDLTIGSGAKFDFDSTTTVMNIKGDFINNGSLNPSQGEVLFSGNEQTIFGNTSFNIMKKANPGTLNFENGSQQTIKSLLFTGSSSDNILLRSTIEGDQWYFDLVDTWQVDYVDVKDGHKIDSPIVAPSNSIDSGNNVNWFNLSSILSEENEKLKFTMFPNPAKNYVHINAKGLRNIQAVDIYDTQGKLMDCSNEHNGSEIKIDISNLKNSVYNVLINYDCNNSNGTCSASKRIVVKN